MQEVKINNFCVKIKKHRFSRRMRLFIKPNGEVKLTMPYFLPYLAGRLFIHEKKQWIVEKLQTLQQENQKTKYSPEQIKNFKKQARLELAELVRYYSQLYVLTPGKIRIKDHQTLWGSCSRKGNLNFNWRLTLVPDTIRRYVVVHEICHLREMNHSANFWELVALTIPDYKLCRKWLRENLNTLY